MNFNIHFLTNSVFYQILWEVMNDLFPLAFFRIWNCKKLCKILVDAN